MHGDVYYGSLVIFLSYKFDALPSDSSLHTVSQCVIPLTTVL